MLEKIDSAEILFIDGLMTDLAKNKDLASKELLVIVNLAFYTGIKRQAIPQLRVGDVKRDGDGNIVSILGFNPDGAVNALDQYLVERHKRSGNRTKLFSIFTDERKIHRRLGRKNFMYSDIQTLGRKRMYEHLKSNQLTEDQIIDSMTRHYHLSANWWKLYKPKLQNHKVEHTPTALDRAKCILNDMIERNYFIGFYINDLKNCIKQITDADELEKFKEFAKENNISFDKLMKSPTPNEAGDNKLDFPY